MFESRWRRRAGSCGAQSMSRTSGGGQATMTRFARAVPRSVCTCAQPSRWTMCRTCARSATRSPSSRAIRIGTVCDPSLKRESCAASAVPDERWNVPTLSSLPAVAMNHANNSIETLPASEPQLGWK
jgi:hypothetical protein